MSFLFKRVLGEIKDLCTKMVALAREAAPEVMLGAGPSCAVLGYCPELEQCEQLKGKMPTKDQALKYLADHRKEILADGE